MILQKFEDLDSLKKHPLKIFEAKKTPFADFRVKNQILICHTSISLAIWNRPPPWAQKQIIEMLLLSNKRLNLLLPSKAGGAPERKERLYNATFDMRLFLTLCQFFDSVSVNPFFLEERIKN